VLQTHAIRTTACDQINYTVATVKKEKWWIIILKMWKGNHLHFEGKFSPERKGLFGVYTYKISPVY